VSASRENGRASVGDCRCRCGGRKTTTIQVAEQLKYDDSLNSRRFYGNGCCSRLRRAAWDVVTSQQ